MTDCKPVDTPMQAGVPQPKNHCPQTIEEQKQMQYVMYTYSPGIQSNPQGPSSIGDSDSRLRVNFHVRFAGACRLEGDTCRLATGPGKIGYS